MPTNGGEEHVLGENTPLALALSKALGSAIVSECDTRSDCIKSSFINNKCNLYLKLLVTIVFNVVRSIISVTCI